MRAPLIAHGSLGVLAVLFVLTGGRGGNESNLLSISSRHQTRFALTRKLVPLSACTASKRRAYHSSNASIRFREDVCWISTPEKSAGPLLRIATATVRQTSPLQQFRQCRLQDPLMPRRNHRIQTGS